MTEGYASLIFLLGWVCFSLSLQYFSREMCTGRLTGPPKKRDWLDGRGCTRIVSRIKRWWHVRKIGWPSHLHLGRAINQISPKVSERYWTNDGGICFSLISPMRWMRAAQAKKRDWTDGDTCHPWHARRIGWLLVVPWSSLPRRTTNQIAP